VDIVDIVDIMGAALQAAAKIQNRTDNRLTRLRVV